MLENQSKKILLLSDDPADASFLSELSVTQQAELELVQNASELCSKIAQSRADQTLAAVFVDVSTPQQLRKFEHELQSKMGSAVALEVGRSVHLISGKSLALNREILQSPYFSFYSERKNYDFAQSVKNYSYSFHRTSDFVQNPTLAFNQSNREQCFEKIKKDLLSKGASAEWTLRFKPLVDEMLEQLFPSRFEFSSSFSNQSFKLTFSSPTELHRDLFHVEKFLNFGVSAMISQRVLVVFVPIFEEAAKAIEEFKFYKVEV